MRYTIYGLLFLSVSLNTVSAFSQTCPEILRSNSPALLQESIRFEEVLIPRHEPRKTPEEIQTEIGRRNRLTTEILNGVESPQSGDSLDPGEIIRISQGTHILTLRNRDVNNRSSDSNYRLGITERSFRNKRSSWRDSENHRDVYSPLRGYRVVIAKDGYGFEVETPDAVFRIQIASVDFEGGFAPVGEVVWDQTGELLAFRSKEGKEWDVLRFNPNRPDALPTFFTSSEIGGEENFGRPVESITWNESNILEVIYADAEESLYARFRVNSFEVNDFKGGLSPVEEFLEDKNLVELLNQNEWSQPFALALKPFADSLDWSQINEGHIRGEGIWNSSIGEISVNIFKNTVQTGIPGMSDVDFYVEFHAHPGHLASAENLLSETGRKFREAENLPDGVGFMPVLSPQPNTEGPYQGYHRGVLYPTVLATASPDGEGFIIQNVSVKEKSQMASIAQGFLSWFFETSKNSPIRPY